MRKRLTDGLLTFIILVGFGLLLGFLLSYGKWEYLTFKYSHEFITPIDQSIQHGCFLETPAKVKVMAYTDQRAKVFMKGRSGSTYLLHFRKTDSRTWSLYRNQVCYFEIINSKFGGSADDIYWYN
ncbi:MAG: hypothetical protein AAF485_11760 [Chloroflexota bacterium]